MKVWIVGNGLTFPHGNASTNRLVEIAKGFEVNGWSAKLIPMELSKNASAITMGRYKGIEYQILSSIVEKSNSSQTIINPFFFAKNVSKQLIKIAKQEDINCIFCGSSSLYTIYLLYFTARRLNVKFIYDIVEDPWSSWTIKDIREFNLKKWIQHLINLFNIPFLYFHAWKLPDKLTVITSELKNKLVKLKYNTDSILILPILKFVEKKEIYRIEDNTPPRNLIIHSGSTYFPKDGIQEILEAIKIVNCRGLQIAIEFYGPIGNFEEKRITYFAKINNLEESIRVIGMVNLEFLYRKQKEALGLICFKPFVQQNRYNFATKIIDYLDAGRPIILSNLPVYLNYFEDGKNALICQKYSPESLADKIETIYSNRTLSNKIGLNGKELLIQKFSAGQLIKDLLIKTC